ncbi:general vesicular transport factor p115 isoform X1 [Maniola hyperantus]|uniref:general vesicular transport factor p115 isoform X1 n=1 Tax=Aphantopus hyperantus TaxID=2795564 RepID=UPI001567EFD3|nr:general vesicular transport factor p115 isoform X1 [Maniola hyperantus]
MNFLKSGIKTVLGAPEPGQQPSVAETVERLVERASNSTLLEDRRDACRALKALSRKYRLEVGAQGIDTLRQILELDRADNETINYALDTLNNIVSPSQFEEEEDKPHIPMNIGDQFTEMFIKDPHNIQLVLDLLDEYDFRVRLATVQLLISLLTNRTKDIQEIILDKPMGVSKMMDLLGDTREVIRNEALLLLIKLTKGNANIQKIVAFENAFDRLFEIVSSEGYSDGGIIVEDCLLLMLNLLKNNSSNINFFKEGSYIQKMLPMFSIPEDTEEVGWSPQKVSNVHCMLQLVRTLVSPSNSAQIISNCQKIMKNSGLLEAMCNILMASGVPADILTETINSVGEVVRGEAANQEFIGNVIAPSYPPRPAIIVLLMSMVNEKQPFPLRCAVLYCFECYLYHNEISQANLVQTLLPSSTDVSSLTSGQILCGGLFSSDVLSNWCAAVALSHALIDNTQQKEQLLRVLLATTVGGNPVSLLHQCTLLLQQTTKLQSKVALLMLLSQWMSNCPAAVSAFLQVPGGVGYLVNQTCSNEHDDNEYLLQGLSAFLLAICIHFNDDSVQNYSKDSLKQLLVKRIGMEVFTAKLSEVSKHELYNKAAKHPQLRGASPADVLIDYEFCRLFKSLESVLSESLSERHENGTEPERSGSEDLEQYKALIRQQDARLHELVHQLDALAQQARGLQSALNDSLAANSLLKDENTLLKAQVSANSIPIPQSTLPSPPQPDPRIGEYEERIQQLNVEVTKLNGEVVRLNGEVTRLNGEVDRLNGEVETAKDAERNATEELEKLKKDQDDLLYLLANYDSKTNEYKMRLLQLGETVEDDEPAEEDNLT